MSFARQVLPGRVYLVTRRCTQRQFLLRPDDETNNAFLYCFAYAAKRHGIETVAFIANSNHYHAVVVDREGRIPKFLEDFHKLLAKHQNALRGGRWENMWATEQTSLVELVDHDDIIDKVLYTLTNPVKDFLVECAHHWPGASSQLANLTGKTLSAKRPFHFFRQNGKMPLSVELTLVQPSALAHLSSDEYRRRLEDGIAEVEAAAALERERTGRQVLGRKAILAQSPFAQPNSRERRRVLNPQVAAKDKEPRKEALMQLKAFRDAHRVAREAWLLGEPAVFPFGTWSLQRLAKVAGPPAFSPA